MPLPRNIIFSYKIDPIKILFYCNKMGPKIQELAFFHITDPFSIWILLKNFQIGPFLADWQTLIFQNSQQYEAQNTDEGYFS